ncbi:MAG: glycosyl hydrolase [Roseivirga sp.]|nr:glycosyl hydrolase [Roseivirga sp.]
MNNRITPLLCLLIASLFITNNALAQRRKRGNTPAAKPTSTLEASTFAGLEFRGIGPGFMSGRIADIAIHPENENIRYVAVASGGVWKTTNAGVTWESVFDGQGSYSTGCVTIDPNNPHVVWVGTGENDGGRHIGFGDGIYRSEDGGNSWTNMGLKSSEHLSKIIVHPGNSDVIYVASQGPLWSKGGERGFYKSIDGGKNWKRTLGDDEWMGVTDMVTDPRNPDRIYAATWQRHRTIAAYMGGGPKTALYRSEDAGETWTKLSSGLPSGKMGKTGLAISYHNPDVIYAAIELDRRTGGLYKSTDRGATWAKQSDAVSGATGPHYYQELYASPHHEGWLYLMDTDVQISKDGGKTFTRLNTEHKHVDNHALAFKKNDPDYLMIGTDGGIYESFDLGAQWRFFPNLPVTQFYKVAVDDAAPFYNIYGGTQDNSTQGGPSRTDNFQGIENSDWSVVLNWDGHQPATEPGNPDIIYAERQEGTLSRVDMTTGEVIDIQPQPSADEDYERFNWDAPILVSPHKPSRIYFASQRVWKSENRGDSWTAISGDLTKNEERLELPIMGGKQSWDSPWDVLAMSNYNTITSLAESPVEAGVIYAGTDDGRVQVTENGGESWRNIDVSNMPGVPATAFVNDIKADLFDANTVYVVLDNHKYGDYQPYIAKSTDRGATWSSIKSNLPDRTLLWRIVQDHVNSALFFLASEFGVYFSIDAGNEWTMLTGGMPTISFRDLAIQRRENDLVAASFGRGFFILDDYTALRGVSKEQLAQEATLFKPRKALWYIPRSHLDFDTPKGSLGSQLYMAPNPDFGAVFTYYLKDDLHSKKAKRQATEKPLSEAGQDIPFPGWDAVKAEAEEQGPHVWLVIKGTDGKVIRRVSAETSKGFHRVSWDLKYPAAGAISLEGENTGFTSLMVAPGSYSATLYKQVDGEVSQLGEPVTFEVEQLREGALAGSSPTETATFWRAYENASKEASKLTLSLTNAMSKAAAMQTALRQSSATPGTLDKEISQLRQRLLDINTAYNGNAGKNQMGAKTRPTIGARLFTLEVGVANSTYGPTATHQQTLKIVNDQLATLNGQLDAAKTEMDRLIKNLIAAGAPWIER